MAPILGDPYRAHEVGLLVRAGPGEGGLQEGGAQLQAQDRFCSTGAFCLLVAVDTKINVLEIVRIIRFNFHHSVVGDFHPR